ncbi:methyltransferase domain-containing protein [Diaphorobacter nitroreducens]|uniref:methyltransferase domain-containing protein n=1 Tax=Diaphorobacter nitroreducens TaxID=164759 RepID=UPI0028A10269|nr:methyltransferase domain-containing protein [Diaphorobacter nitroreducens]
MAQALTYETFERLPRSKPVDRIGYIARCCHGKVVLDIGCLDETALQKRDTEHWLHKRIANVATRVFGVDSSSKIPDEGLETADNAKIVRGDGVELSPAIITADNFQIIVAGEFIEHIESPLRFFRNMRTAFPGRELVISTPNGAAFANTLLGMIRREVQHPDHLHLFSYKVLNTLCMRVGFSDWEIVPYRFYATEMILGSSGARRVFVQFVEWIIRTVERMFPLLCFGYIVRVRL